MLNIDAQIGLACLIVIGTAEFALVVVAVVVVAATAIGDGMQVRRRCFQVLIWMIVD
jgi:hypothetical protein